MIKVENGIATRDPIPAFLRGLRPESLADLSWTDPALGVSNAAWWPEVDQSPVLNQYQEYGEETLTPDPDSKTVIVTRAVIDWTQQQIDEYESEQATARRADMVVTPRQARLALLQNGLLSQVDAVIASLPEPQKSIAQTDWEYAVSIERNSPWIGQIGAALGLDDAGLDDLFTLAATL